MSAPSAAGRTVPGGFDALPDRDGEIVSVAVGPRRIDVRLGWDDARGVFEYAPIEPTLSAAEAALADRVRAAIVAAYAADGPAIPFAEADPDSQLAQALDDALARLGVAVSADLRDRLGYHLRREFVGYGPVEVPMHDPEIEEVSCAGPGRAVYVTHRRFGPMRTTIVFPEPAALDRWVARFAERAGRPLSIARPIAEGTLDDGSRLSATLGREVTAWGSSFAIRRWSTRPYTPAELVARGTFSAEMMAFLAMAVERGTSVLVIGGTAGGKTTTLNALLSFLPPRAKVVSIEDTRELRLAREHWLPLVTRPSVEPSSAGGSPDDEVGLFELLTTALRERPDHLVVGEVRGREAYTFFQAMAMGQSSFATFHADSVSALVRRLEHPPLDLPRTFLTALPLVLVQRSVTVGGRVERKAVELTEIVEDDPETGELVTNPVYRWRPAERRWAASGYSRLFERWASAEGRSVADLEAERDRRAAAFARGADPPA